MAEKRSNRWLAELEAREGLAATIRAMLGVLPVRDKWCVEFGAWDGLLASTTRDLIVGRECRAVLIEADAEKFLELQRNYSQQQNVTTRQGFVGFGPDDSLDVILSRTAIPRDFDFVSIDIDGNDYHVWRATERYRPSVAHGPASPPWLHLPGRNATSSWLSSASMRSSSRRSTSRCWALKTTASPCCGLSPRLLAAE